MKIKYILLIVNLLSFCFNSLGQQFVNLDAKATEATFIYTKANGYKGYGIGISFPITSIYINTVEEWLYILLITDLLRYIL